MKQNFKKVRETFAKVCRTATTTAQRIKTEWIAWEYLTDPNDDFVSVREDAAGNVYAVTSHKTNRPSISKVAKDRIGRISGKFVSEQDIRRSWEFLAKDAKWVDDVYEIDLKKAQARFEKGEKWNDMKSPKSNGDKAQPYEKIANQVINMEADKALKSEMLQIMFDDLYNKGMRPSKK